MSLRERQVAMARQAIVDACAALVNEHRHIDFAMRDVAERAGVSLRTVYNYFPAREDLLDALGQRVDEEIAARGGPVAHDLGSGIDLYEAIRANLVIFEDLGGISEAFAQLPLADVGRDEGRRRRTAEIVEHTKSLMPGVADQEAEEIALVLRHLLSHRSWFWLTREYGLTTERTIALVRWAAQTLIEAANAGDLPERTEQP